MTPKEKVSELFEKHTEVLFNVGLAINKELVKQSVLLCVDEILNNSRSSIPILIPSNELVCSPEYWQEVKNQIEKL